MKGTLREEVHGRVTRLEIKAESFAEERFLTALNKALSVEGGCVILTVSGRSLLTWRTEESS